MRPLLETIPDVKFDEAGRVIVDKATMQTNNPKYFAGGDCVNGGREAVDAAQMGKLAAQGIHKFVTGEDVEFAGARLPLSKRFTARWKQRFHWLPLIQQHRRKV
jgi:NADH dehydrogenase FAD-containing subunit